MRNKAIQEQISACEAAIRAGSIKNAIGYLSGINLARVPREYRLTLANLARRTNQFSIGLRLLGPLVHNSDRRFDQPATSSELAEYALLLQRIGSIREALGILERVDKKKTPFGYFVQASCYMNQWDYERALPCWDALVRAPVIDYDRMIARVNQVATLIALDFYQEALEILDPLLHETRSLNYSRLYFNCLELRGQAYIGAGEYKAAGRDLELANRLASQAGALDRFYIDKWRVILDVRKGGDIKLLGLLKAEALRRNDAESAREADFHSLRAHFDQNLFDLLYFGTPFPAYRLRMQKEIKALPSADSFVTGNIEAPCFDLASGELAGKTMLREGSKIHQLLDILLLDFYRRPSVGAVFAALYPDRHFDTHSSTTLVHQQVRLARRWFEDSRIPCEIENDGGYRILMTGPFGFRVRLERAQPDRNRILLERLNKKFSNESFSADEAREICALSRAQFKAFAVWATNTGVLVKFGAGPATRYSLAG